MSKRTDESIYVELKILIQTLGPGTTSRDKKLMKKREERNEYFRILKSRGHTSTSISEKLGKCSAYVSQTLRKKKVRIEKQKKREMKSKVIGKKLKEILHKQGLSHSPIDQANMINTLLKSGFEKKEIFKAMRIKLTKEKEHEIELIKTILEDYKLTRREQ